MRYSNVKKSWQSNDNQTLSSRIYGEKKGFSRPTPQLELDDETDDFQDERSPMGRSVGIEIDEYEDSVYSMCGD